MRSTHSIDYERVIGELIHARKRARVTQREIGARLGRDQSFVSKFERRERRLDFVEFKQVCDALDLDPSDLLEKIGTTAADAPSTRPTKEATT